ILFPNDGLSSRARGPSIGPWKKRLSALEDRHSEKGITLHYSNSKFELRGLFKRPGGKSNCWDNLRQLKKYDQENEWNRLNIQWARRKLRRSMMKPARKSSSFRSNKIRPLCGRLFRDYPTNRSGHFTRIGPSGKSSIISRTATSTAI